MAAASSSSEAMPSTPQEKARPRSRANSLTDLNRSQGLEERHSRSRMGAPQGSSSLKPATPLYFNYRAKDSAALSRIEHSPIVVLYPGSKVGGTSSSLSKPSPHKKRLGIMDHGGATPEQRRFPAVFEQHPKFESQVEDLIQKCTYNQRGTRSLFQQMNNEEAELGEKISVLQDKLRIMQSMPDISMPAQEFELFVSNAMEQQKALDKDLSGQFSADSLPVKHRGSIRHIFPLRNVHTGRVAKGEHTTIWRV